VKKSYYYIFFAIVGLLLLFIYRKTVVKTMSNLPRGLRNNNPGNIRKTPTMWQGEVTGTDKSFKTFVSMEYGYRAMFVLLRSYIDKGYDTIEKIITRYAPPSENTTSSYIKHVTERTGISKNKKLKFSDSQSMKDLVAAISKSENGVNADLSKVEQGFNLIGM